MNVENSHHVANYQHQIQGKKKKKNVWRSVKKSVRRSLGGGSQKKAQMALPPPNYGGQRPPASESFSIDDLIGQQYATPANCHSSARNSHPLNRKIDATEQPNIFAVTSSMASEQNVKASRSKGVRFWKKKSRSTKQYATSADLETLDFHVMSIRPSYGQEKRNVGNQPPHGPNPPIPPSVAQQHQPRRPQISDARPSHPPAQQVLQSVGGAQLQQTSHHQGSVDRWDAAQGGIQRGLQNKQPQQQHQQPHQQQQYPLQHKQQHQQQQHQQQKNVRSPPPHARLSSPKPLQTQQEPDTRNVDELLRLSQEKAQLMEEEVRRFQMEKMYSSKMQIEAAKKRIQELMLVMQIRNNIFKTAPAGSEEMKFTFWGGKKMGFKVKLEDNYPHVVNVSSGDQAEEKGMQVGDMIIGINNNTLDKQRSYESFVSLLKSSRHPCVLNVLRKPAKDAKIRTADKFFNIQCSRQSMGKNGDDVGFELADENYNVYVVGSVSMGSVVHRQGVREGDVLVGINGTPFPATLPVEDVMSIICTNNDPVFTLDFCRELNQLPQPSMRPSSANFNSKPLLKSTRCEDTRAPKKSVMFCEEPANR